MDADHRDFLLIIYLRYAQLCRTGNIALSHINHTHFILWVCSVMQATIRQNRKHSSKHWISLKMSLTHIIQRVETIFRVQMLQISC